MVQRGVGGLCQTAVKDLSCFIRAKEGHVQETVTHLDNTRLAPDQRTKLTEERLYGQCSVCPWGMAAKSPP